MARRRHRMAATVLVVLALLLAGMPAHAFRCGNKIVTKNMHEQQVRRACGAPTTMRNLGLALRSFHIPIERRYGNGMTGRHFPGYGSYVQEVVVTEYVYNFGPRKLMRRLLFEGGILVDIDTIGYGYIEKK